MRASAAAVRDNAVPEIRKALSLGHIAVSLAAQASRLPAEQQRRIADRAAAGDEGAARSVIKQRLVRPPYEGDSASYHCNFERVENESSAPHDRCRKFVVRLRSPRRADHATIFRQPK